MAIVHTYPPGRGLVNVLLSILLIVFLIFLIIWVVVSCSRAAGEEESLNPAVRRVDTSVSLASSTATTIVPTPTATAVTIEIVRTVIVERVNEIQVQRDIYLPPQERIINCARCNSNYRRVDVYIAPVTQEYCTNCSTVNEVGPINCARCGKGEVVEPVIVNCSRCGNPSSESNEASSCCQETFVDRPTNYPTPIAR